MPTAKQILIDHLEGELSFSIDEGIPTLSFPEDKIEDVADEILKAINQ